VTVRIEPDGDGLFAVIAEGPTAFVRYDGLTLAEALALAEALRTEAELLKIG
jgi:hypothetical protein